jgi:hypothetical protein
MLNPTAELRAAQNAIVRWRSDPVAFVKDVFGATPEPWQALALASIVTNDRITIRSSHGVGKTTMLAWAIIWYMSTHYPVKVPCTAPSSNQLYDVLWAEVRLWLRKAVPAIRDQFVVKSDRIELVGGGDSFASARTSRKEAPDALQGFHSENLLFVVDEASGVDDIIFEVARGAMSTQGAKQILTGNPTKTTGYFARSHAPDSGFYKMHVSHSDSSLVSPEWVEEMKKEYGIDSNVYRIRVMGEFPTSDSEALMSTDSVMSAVGRDIQPNGKERCIWGLDVARYGTDRSCLVKRYPRIMKDAPIVYNGLSLMELTGRVVAEYNKCTESEKPDKIYVDVIGLGAGVVDRLLELKLPAVGINVSESPSVMADQVFRMRDELWLAAANWFEAKSCNLVNCKETETLTAELCSVKKSYTSSGKMRAESKDDMRRRGLRSPDIADAFVLTFAYQYGVISGASIGKQSDWKKPLHRASEGTYV